MDTGPGSGHPGDQFRPFGGAWSRTLPLPKPGPVFSNLSLSWVARVPGTRVLVHRPDLLSVAQLRPCIEYMPYFAGVKENRKGLVLVGPKIRVGQFEPVIVVRIGPAYTVPQCFHCEVMTEKL